MSTPDLFEVFRQQPDDDDGPSLVDTPEPASYVDAPQVPALPGKWSWSSTTLVYVALGVLALGFVVYFVMQFSSWSAAVDKTVEAVTPDAGQQQ